MPPASAPRSRASRGGDLGGLEAVQARGYWELVWRRFRRDKVAIASAIFIVLLILTAFVGAPIAKNYVGHGPNDIFAAVPRRSSSCRACSRRADDALHEPRTRGGHDVMVLGAANRLGQDEFLRLLYGARVSLEVALFSTIGVMIIGVILGASAGYFRGATDTVISRLTEITMAFPLLLFVIALAATVGPRLNDDHVGSLPSRGGHARPDLQHLRLVLSGQDHARAGALDPREGVRRGGPDDRRERRADHPLHVLPHLVAPMIVYSTLIVASYVLSRSRPVVPRRGHPAHGPELGQPALERARVLHDAAAAHGLARSGRADDDARVQPARRRAPRCVRSALRRAARTTGGAN